MRLGRVLLLIGSLKDGFLRRSSKIELRLQICVKRVPKIDQLFHTFFKKSEIDCALRAPAVHGVSSIRMWHLRFRRKFGSHTSNRTHADKYYFLMNLIH